MKLFIVTAPDNTTEATIYGESLASVAIALENSKYAIRTIEEVPDGELTGITPKIPAFCNECHTWPKTYV